MKVFDQYTQDIRRDYFEARKRSESVTMRPPNVDVEAIVNTFYGDPSYIFWDRCCDDYIAYAIPYTNLTHRRDNVVKLFDLRHGCRLLSMTPPGLSKAWKVVADIGGEYLAFSGLKLYHLIDQIEKFSPDIIQITTPTLRRLISRGVTMPALRRIVVVGGGCCEADPEVMADAQKFYAVPVVTFLTFAWLGPVAMTDGESFEPGLVGSPIGKVEIEIDAEGYFCLRSPMTRGAQMHYGRQWLPLDHRFYRSAVRGRQGKVGLYVTERPVVAMPPQPMDR